MTLFSSPPRPVRALVFDFDGTILDTELPDYQSWQEIYAQHDCRLSLEDWARCLGTNYEHFNPYDHLETLCGYSVDRETLAQQHLERVVKMLEAQEVADGVRDLIAAARDRGLKTAVASSSGRDWVGGHLTRLGLIESFDCVRCREDVDRVKPDPALYLSAVTALGVSPHEAVAFEDSPNGVRAAKAAGLYCIAVPNTVSETLCFAHADRRAAGFREITLEALLDGSHA